MFFKGLARETGRVDQRASRACRVGALGERMLRTPGLAGQQQMIRSVGLSQTRRTPKDTRDEVENGLRLLIAFGFLQQLH